MLSSSATVSLVWAFTGITTWLTKAVAGAICRAEAWLLQHRPERTYCILDFYFILISSKIAFTPITVFKTATAQTAASLAFFRCWRTDPSRASLSWHGAGSLGQVAQEMSPAPSFLLGPRLVEPALGDPKRRTRALLCSGVLGRMKSAGLVLGAT